MRITKVLVVIAVMLMAFATTPTVMATTENPLAIEPAAGTPQVATATSGQIMASAVTIIGQSQTMELLYEKNEVVAINTASPPSLSAGGMATEMATYSSTWMGQNAIPDLLVPTLRC